MANAGGAAMSAGGEFQARIAAWAAVHVLAETDVEPPFRLTGALESVACEGVDPVDDIVVRTHEGHTAYLQVKRSVSLPRNRRFANGRLTPLASAIDQFVRQFKLRNDESTGIGRPLDATHDRLVLVVGSGVQNTISQNLRAVLDRLRDQPPGDPLDAPTLSKSESRALCVVRDLAREAWVEAHDSKPTDAELHAFLRLVYVEKLEIEEHEPAEAVAKGILRRSVLGDPGQADAVWQRLVSIARKLMSTRGSIDRAALSRALAAAGIYSCGPRSYGEDVDRLRQHSERIISRLAGDASILRGGESVEITRPYVEALRVAAELGSTLVVGEPGAGKSGVLYGLARTLVDQGCDVLMLTAQEPPFTTLGELRDELLLQHDIIDVLATWSGPGPGFLLIDALDAARTDPSASALRSLIREVSERAPRWRVIASIREYDLRYGKQIRLLFKGEPVAAPIPGLSHPKFADVRHIVVERLSNGEVAQLEVSAPQLHELISSAPPPVADLLHNLFNLRLAAELLDGGTDPSEIQGVRSQLDLLAVYWEERVLDGTEARIREVVLRKVVTIMVQDRSLRVDRDLVEDTSSARALDDLLSAQVLVEWLRDARGSPSRSSLTFAHHVLFDFAVERLLLDRSPPRVVEFLDNDPAFVLLGRPSLVMYFHELWDSEPGREAPEDFWRVVLGIAASPNIPEIGKLIGPGVSMERARNVEDFGPLLLALEATDERVRAPAESAYNHMIRTAISEPGAKGASSNILCAIVERASRVFTDQTAYPTRALLFDITEDVEGLASEDQARVGEAARRLLEFAWRRPSRDRWLVTHAIQCVCRTFASNAAASAALIRRAIEASHLADHGCEELPSLAIALPAILRHDPVLVGDIYVAAFGYRETSDDPLPMGGIVIPLISNRRQDYSGALHALARAFPSFLEAAPRDAVVAMNAALEYHVAKEHGPRPQEPLGFELDGHAAMLLPDYSHIWDSGHARPNEDAVVLLDHVQARVDELAVSAGSNEELTQLLIALVMISRPAVIWRRLLQVGARHPETVGVELRALTWALPILTCEDTSAAAGEMIRTVFQHLSQEDRERIEGTILSIPNEAAEKRRELSERTRDRLLGCLPEGSIVTKAARDRRTLLEATEVPVNDDSPPVFQAMGGRYGEAECLAEEGVPVEDEPNRRVRELEEPVKKFATTYLNEVPDERAVAGVLPDLRALRESLSCADSDGVHRKQADYAWGTLAEACTAVARTQGLSCVAEPGAFVREALLVASHNEIPEPDPEADGRFTRARWDNPAARIDAAAGLVALASDPSCADAEVLSALDRLSADPSPAVRYQVAVRLLAFFEHAPERFWDMLERMVTDEMSLGVLQGLLQSPLYLLRFSEPERVANLVIGIQERIASWQDTDDVKNCCVDVLAGLFIDGKHERSAEIILDLANCPLEHLAQTQHLVGRCREILISGPVDKSDPSADAARGRVMDFLLRTTQSAVQLLNQSLETRTDMVEGDAQPDLSEKQIEIVAHILDGVGWNLYFASGAHSDDGAIDERVRARLFQEAGPIIDELATVGLPHLTHHILETLEVFIQFAPRSVFMKVVAAIRGGTKGDYQFDAMAEPIIVRIVEQYLAEYRDVFREDEDARRGLIEILDTFVRAGRVATRELSYGLADIFR